MEINLRHSKTQKKGRITKLNMGNNTGAIRPVEILYNWWKIRKRSKQQHLFSFSLQQIKKYWNALMNEMNWSYKEQWRYMVLGKDLQPPYNKERLSKD